MKKTIKVKIKPEKSYSYEIEIADNLFEKMAADLKRWDLAHNYAVVSDSNVSKLYSHRISRALKSNGLKFKLIIFPPGEKSKNSKIKELIESKMFEFKMGRDSAIIALGGGVVGDIAGFVASTYNRGIPYIQYPTTLVACVDSSIGGKTGIDTKFGKNLVGSFYQPKKVYIDIDTLKTLNKKEIKEGMAEVIKYGIIQDSGLFKYIDKNIDRIYSYDSKVLFHIIKKSCEIKSYIVENDEKESNLRKILNFGHTIGHAVEQLSKYEITHGNAISMGMNIEAKIAHINNILSKKDVEGICRLFRKAGLPTNISSTIKSKNILEVMKLDKKTRKGRIEFALPDKIGHMHHINGNYGLIVPEHIINAVINQ